MNRVQLMGNLTRDPDLRTTQEGIAVANISLAVNRRKKNGTDETVYVDITMWDKRAEAFCRFHQKGAKALIEGRLSMDTWTDKESGNPRTKLKVTAESWEFVDSKAPARPF